MKAVIIHTDGTRQVVEFTNATCYETLSNAVGGLIECVSLPDLDMDLWCNDNGRAEGLGPNPAASQLYIDQYPMVIDGVDEKYHNYAIVGDAIITGGADDEGNTLGLTDEQVEQLLNPLPTYHLQVASSDSYVYNTQMIQDSELPISRTYITDDLLVSVSRRHTRSGMVPDESIRSTPANTNHPTLRTRTAKIDKDSNIHNEDLVLTHVISETAEWVSVIVGEFLTEVFVVTDKREYFPAADELVTLVMSGDQGEGDDI